MRASDKNGKLFGVLNLLDLLLIVIVIAVVAVGVLYFRGGKSGSQEVYFTVEFRSVKKEYAEKIKVGDQIKDSIKDSYLGVVSNVEVIPEKAINWSVEEKRFVESESPDDYTVNIEIKSNGTVTESDVFVDSAKMSIKVGKDISIKGKGYANSGYVVAMRYTEGAAQ